MLKTHDLSVWIMSFTNLILPPTCGWLVGYLRTIYDISDIGKQHRCFCQLLWQESIGKKSEESTRVRGKFNHQALFINVNNWLLEIIPQLWGKYCEEQSMTFLKFLFGWQTAGGHPSKYLATYSRSRIMKLWFLLYLLVWPVWLIDIRFIYVKEDVSLLSLFMTRKGPSGPC